MTEPARQDGLVVPDDTPVESPRADLMDALGWLLLGAAILAGSITMDRLENQDVPPYAVPGLLPGLLGIALLLLGGLLVLRSMSRGAMGGATVRHPAPGNRAATVIALCVLFGTVLVGHGLPFWVAAALFVTAAILLLRRGPAGGRPRIDAKAVAAAALIGLGAGGAITLVFQQIFLVRLP